LAYISEDLPGLVKGIAGLHPQSPSHFARQPSARVSGLTVLLAESRDCSCYVSNECWQLHRSDCRKGLIYAMYVIAGGMNEQMKQNHALNFNRRLRKRRHRLLGISCSVV